MKVRSGDMSPNQYGGWRRKLGAFFGVFTHYKAERRRVFGAVFVFAFLYALINDLALHRSPAAIANEVISICVAGTIALPLIYVARQLKKHPRSQSWAEEQHAYELTPFTVPEERYKSRFHAISLIIFCLVGLFGFCQTQAFVALCPAPKREVILKHMRDSKAKQSEIAAWYVGHTGKEPERGVVFSGLFTDEQRNALEEALRYLWADERLNSQLKQGLGVTLRDADAVIIPGWFAYNPANSEQFGITEDAWKAVSKQETHIFFDIEGYIVRENIALKSQSTLDGTPRVFISYGAFMSQDTLRLTLFHTLLHALNVPGYRPSRLALVQDDLVYLPEYRSILREERFQGQLKEVSIWFTLVIIPFLVAVLNLVKIYHYW